VEDEVNTSSPKLVRATANALLLSNGHVIVIASLTPDECEHLAIELRAEAGIVPYGLWAALTDGSRGKISRMSQAKAQRMLACENKQL
jgi:hypothetical protein